MNVRIKWVEGARKTGPPPLDFDYVANFRVKSEAPNTLWSCVLTDRMKTGEFEETARIAWFCSSDEVFGETGHSMDFYITEGLNVVAEGCFID